MDVDTLSRYGDAKRLALVACLAHAARMRARDDLAEMLCKRVSSIVKKAKTELEEIRLRQRAVSEKLIGTYRTVLESLDPDGEEPGGDPARAVAAVEVDHATGGDAAALAEIAAAHALISTSTPPDLLAALRLAWYRDQLTDRNTHIPSNSQRYGQFSASPHAPKPSPGPSPPPTRRRRPWQAWRRRRPGPATTNAPGALAAGAEQVARSITRPDAQTRALARVASVAEPVRARSCIAGALAAGGRAIPLKELADIDPVALSAFADELLARDSARCTG